MFGQTFAPPDLATVAVLVVLESVLSIDNALVLGLLAGRLPRKQRMRALSYGLVGAFLLRLVMIGTAAYLLRWEILKVAGGVYLLWVGGKYFFLKRRGEVAVHEVVEVASPGFWSTVAAIELTDVAFAVDSILAAVALVGPAAGTPRGEIHPKLWVIVLGGMIGVVLMRFAAAIFAVLMERFPRLTRSAYLLVMLIGVKMLVEWACDNPPQAPRLDFQSPESGAFWVFWILLASVLASGFIGGRKRQE